MKTVPFAFHGETYHLCLNGAALFDIYERYGQKGSVLDVIKDGGKKSFVATCWYLAKLAEQGELVRRYQGHDRGKIPSEMVFRTLMRPAEYPAAKLAVQEAVLQGFAREEDPEEGQPVDLGLRELEKKTNEG